MAEHYRMELISGGNWRRCVEQSPATATSPTDEARLHAVPITDQAQKIAIAEAAKWVRITGLCPGEIKQDDKWMVAYRFIRIDSDPDALLASMDKLINSYFAECNAKDSVTVLATVGD